MLLYIFLATSCLSFIVVKPKGYMFLQSQMGLGFARKPFQCFSLQSQSQSFRRVAEPFLCSASRRTGLTKLRCFARRSSVGIAKLFFVQIFDLQKTQTSGLQRTQISDSLRFAKDELRTGAKGMCKAQTLHSLQLRRRKEHCTQSSVGGKAYGDSA